MLVIASHTPYRIPATPTTLKPLLATFSHARRAAARAPTTSPEFRAARTLSMAAWISCGELCFVTPLTSGSFMLIFCLPCCARATSTSVGGRLALSGSSGQLPLVFSESGHKPNGSLKLTGSPACGAPPFLVQVRSQNYDAPAWIVNSNVEGRTPV